MILLINVIPAKADLTSIPQNDTTYSTLFFGSPDNVEWMWESGSKKSGPEFTSEYYSCELVSGEKLTVSIFHKPMADDGVMCGMNIMAIRDTGIIRDSEEVYVGAVWYPENCDSTSVIITAIADTKVHIIFELTEKSNSGACVGTDYNMKSTKELEYNGQVDSGWTPEEPQQSIGGFDLLLVLPLIFVSMVFLLRIVIKSRRKR